MIKTWNERCQDHPDHQTGMVSERMIQMRMQEEIDELRDALEQRKPLTDEALMALLPGAVRLPPGWKDFARAIEKAHGIS